MSPDTMILKHPLSVRMFHYFLILSFLPLAVTGILLYLKPFADTGMHLTMQIHAFAGVVLTIACVSFFFLAYDRVVLFIRRVFSFSGVDLKWFAVLGGYPQKLILKKKVAIPPMGKYNSGQKLFGIFVLVGGVLLIVSGWILWGFPHSMPRGFVALMGDIHLVAGIVLALFLCVHLFLGVYMFDDFKAMIIHGKIPYEEAKEMSPKWVEKEIVPVLFKKS